MRGIYCDYNADTPTDPRVIEKMMQVYQLYGNASSVHHYGRTMRHLLEESRRSVASFFKVASQEVVFTSGATEAINTLFQGFIGPIVTSGLEHACVVHAAERAQKIKPVRILYPKGGVMTPQGLEPSLQEGPCLVILSSVHHETGVKLDVEGIAALVYRYGSSLFLDATAHVGKEPFTWYPGVVGLCCSGHKMYGPQGIGVLILRKPFSIEPLLVGGGQEQGMRSGTPPIPEICGFAEACRIFQPMDSSIRDAFEELIQQSCSVVIHGQHLCRVSNTSYVGFKTYDGESLMIYLDQQGIAVSLGSACGAGTISISKVLQSMDVPHDIIRNSLRFSFGRYTTLEEVHAVIRVLRHYKDH